MKIDIEDTGAWQKNICVVVPSEVASATYEKNIAEAMGVAEIKGFRKGQAPRKLVEQRLGDAFLDQVKQSIIQESIADAMKDVEDSLIGEPQLEKPVEFKVGEDATYTVSVEVKPTFELPEFKGIEVVCPNNDISEDDVKKELESFQMSRSTMDEVEGATAGEEDMLNAEATLTVDDVEVKKEEALSLSLSSQSIFGITIDNLSTVLLGTTAGDTREIGVEIPDTFVDEDVRGKKGQIVVSVKGVRQRNTPELTDDFIKEASNGEEESIESMSKRIRAWMGDTKKQEREKAINEQIAETLAARLDIDMPPRLLDSVIDQLTVGRMRQLMSMGMPQESLKGMFPMMRESSREQAVIEVKSQLIYEMIADTEKVETTEEEIDARILEMARADNSSAVKKRQELEANNQLGSIEYALRDEKVIALIAESAEITELDAEAWQKRQEEIAKQEENARKVASDNAGASVGEGEELEGLEETK